MYLLTEAAFICADVALFIKYLSNDWVDMGIQSKQTLIV